MVAFWLAIATLWQRELRRFWRERSRVLGLVASPLVFWLIIGFGSGEQGPKFFFPGTVVLTVMFAAIFSTISIIEDRREGFLLSMLVSPAPRSGLVLGKILGSATLAWVQGTILLAFTPLAGFRLSLAGLAWVAAAILLVALALASMGFLVAWRFDSSQGYHAVMNLVMMPMWLVSGSVFSISSAHGWIRLIMLVNPLTYATSLVRRLLAPEMAAGDPTVTVCLGVLVAFSAVLLSGSAISAAGRS